MCAAPDRCVWLPRVELSKSEKLLVKRGVASELCVKRAGPASSLNEENSLAVACCKLLYFRAPGRCGEFL